MIYSSKAVNAVLHTCDVLQINGTESQRKKKHGALYDAICVVKDCVKQKTIRTTN